jgi:hypothetical protein
MRITQLTDTERAFLRHLLKEQLDYYRILNANTLASDRTRSNLAFIESLWAKLQLDATTNVKS